MNRDAVDRQRSALADAGLDALISISPENVIYTTGFAVPSQPLMRWRHAAAVVTSDGRSAMLAIDMEETTVRSDPEITNLRVYKEFVDDPMDKLAELLIALGFERKRIAIELDYLPAKDFATLQRRLPGAEIVAGGAENFKLMIIASGERSQYPNVGPTARALKPGDLIRMEIFGQKNGYLAGICRTAVVEGATPEQQKIWKNLIECKYLVMDMIKPGASCKEVYRKFLERFGALGLEPISFVGHGIGLALHEEPYLGRRS